MTIKADILWYKMCIHDREIKLAELKPLLMALQKSVLGIEAKLKNDRYMLRELESKNNDAE
jgi:hypothetical protein